MYIYIYNSYILRAYIVGRKQVYGSHVIKCLKACLHPTRKEETEPSWHLNEALEHLAQQV